MGRYGGVSPEVSDPVSAMKTFTETPDQTWLMCEGGKVTKAGYPDLFDKIGHEFLTPTVTGSTSTTDVRATLPPIAVRGKGSTYKTT